MYKQRKFNRAKEPLKKVIKLAPESEYAQKAIKVLQKIDDQLQLVGAS